MGNEKHLIRKKILVLYIDTGRGASQFNEKETFPGRVTCRNGTETSEERGGTF